MKTRVRQRGALFIVMATVLVLGFAWFTVGALGKAAVSQANRDAKTAAALQAGKKALLSYVAQYAARTGAGYEFPGRMPCPESLNAPGTANEGEAPGACSNTVAEIGRLPWKTLGIDQLRDADGEPLWYALSPNFHPVAFPLNPAPPNPHLNFGTPATLQYDHDGDAATPAIMVVAVILAPGRALKSNPCSGVVQTINRYAVPLEPRKFFECDTPAGGNNATGVPYYTNPGIGSPSNDHALAITREEWTSAIAGPVADRIQRQVAPAMADFRATASLASWGRNYLPYASRWDSVANAPPTNNLCGNEDFLTGMPPTATVASGTCNTDWTSGDASNFIQLVDLDFKGCTVDANGVTCDFRFVLPGIFSPRIRVEAPRIAYSFRVFDPASVLISTDNGLTWASATVNSYTATIDTFDGHATSRFNVVFPLLALAPRALIRVPHPKDALAPDPRAAWFLGNAWDRYTHYAITSAATVDPSGTCNPGGTVSACLRVNGMPAPFNDKRFVLTLMGPAPMPGKAWPSASVGDYMELENGSPNDQQFETRAVTATFNDRLAACPFRYTNAAGTPVTICN